MTKAKNSTPPCSNMFKMMLCVFTAPKANSAHSPLYHPIPVNGEFKTLIMVCVQIYVLPEKVASFPTKIKNFSVNPPVGKNLDICKTKSKKMKTMTSAMPINATLLNNLSFLQKII